jgi:flavorubredoxin
MSPFDIDTSIPVPRQRPLEIAEETFLIRALAHSVGGTWTNLNSMVIRAQEPVIVDTGMLTHREEWFEDVFSLVEPEDVRWIFVTHIDGDHAGNLVEALARCPNASVITSAAESFRMAGCLGVTKARMRFVGDGESFAAGDRTLHAIRPPVYDSPYTRGLFDPETRVYYAADAFCAPMPEGAVDWTDEIPAPLWAEGFARFHHASLCPWVSLVDPVRFAREVDGLRRLGIETIAGAHSPAIRAGAVEKGLGEMERLPLFDPARAP